MAIIEDNGESLRKCEWCGKSEINPMWSGKKAIYCSFRCSAAGSYRLYAVISTIFIIMISMIVILFMMVQIQSTDGYTAILVLIVPQVGLGFLCLFAIYAAYVGRSMRKEREASQLRE